jgi:hypothetical protein
MLCCGVGTSALKQIRTFSAFQHYFSLSAGKIDDIQEFSALKYELFAWTIHVYSFQTKSIFKIEYYASPVLFSHSTASSLYTICRVFIFLFHGGQSIGEVRAKNGPRLY